ncbi:MAG: hypothetical protein HY044_04550 [Candidatus Woesebacteria bacterium]|nr:MAG: hypothetical protein HY044_04550 [Candidatus Woesebacteria bacterium]
MAARKRKKTSSHKSFVSHKSQNDLIALLATAIIAIAFIFLLINNNPRGKTQVSQAVPTINPNETRIILGQQNGSYETGMAVLSEKDGKTTVSITVNGQPKGIAQPAHIHTGACPNPGAVLYPLSSVINNVSTTVLNVKLSDLMKKLPLAINIHQSATQMGNYVSCGNFLK